MENSSPHSNKCVNCGHDFLSENQSRTRHFSFAIKKSPNELNITNEESIEMEIQILDAIYYIFGISGQDLYGENEAISLCCYCTPLLNKLYHSYKDFKKMSQKDSLLWHSVKWKRNEVTVKSEFPLEDLENAKSFSSFDFTSTAGHSQSKSINCKNVIDGNRHHVYSENKSEKISRNLICGDVFDENYMVDDTPPTPDPFFDQDCKNVKPVAIGKSTFPGISRYRKPIKRFRGKRETVQSRSRLHRKPIKKDTSETGNRRIKLGRKKRSTNVGGKSLEWKVQHMDSLTGAVPIKCCNIHFENDTDFISHAKQSHENETEKLEQECEICKRKILSKYLDFHTKVLHQDLSAFECSICQKNFSSKSKKFKHRQTIHKMLPEKKQNTRVFCKECNKYFNYAFFHSYHKPVIHKKDDQKFQCQFCGSNLNSEVYLKTHIHLYHSGNSSKCCDKCGKIFKNSYDLSRHKRTHEADLVTDKEQFKCTQCGITLKHKSSLRKHIYQMHGKASLKTFSCELCGKTTKTMTNMRIHMKVHDPNRNMKQRFSNAKPPNVKPNELIPSQLENNTFQITNFNEEIQNHFFVE